VNVVALFWKPELLCWRINLGVYEVSVLANNRARELHKGFNRVPLLDGRESTIEIRIRNNTYFACKMNIWIFLFRV